MGAEALGDGAGERITIDGQGAARGQAVGVGHFHDQPAGRAHFPMQQAHGVLFVIIRAEGVGAHHLGQVAGAVGEGADRRAHLVDHHVDAHAGGLPRGFRSGHSAADDV